MEKPLFRSNLEQIKRAFGEAQLLPICKVAKFLGIHPDTLRAKQDFPKKRVGRQWYVTAVALAQWMS